MNDKGLKDIAEAMGELSLDVDRPNLEAAIHSQLRALVLATALEVGGPEAHDEMRLRLED